MADGTQENPPRWATDPTGRHEYRYWSGEAWTDHVSDSGIVSTDPPVPSPPGTVPRTPAPAAASAGSGAAPTGPDPTSVLGRRYGAFFIDLAVCLVVFSALFFPFATSRSRAETLRLPGCHLSTGSSFSDSSSDNIECDNRAIFQVGDTVYETDFLPYFAAIVAFTLLYFAVAEAFAGATLGKLVTGIRVVDEEGNKIGLGRALVRWIAFAVDGPLSLFLCGIITSSVSRGHRRLGDMGANSYVVRRTDAGTPLVIPPS